MSDRVELAVVGSGFAGTILARIARAQGLDVVLLERGEHPRFAIGESSTPLGNLCLRRLAARYGLEDLRDLASYGRWRARFPELRRGLKRGFTFYAQRPGRRYPPRADSRRRLLVAASPDDEVADTHWLRADVDAFLVRRAVEEGVDYRPRTELTGVERTAGGWRLTCVRDGRRTRLRAAGVVDASGAAGALARRPPIAAGAAPVRPRSGLVYGHFSGVKSFPFVAGAGEGDSFPPGPYPDERAAVHHLLEEGWLYVLPFDHDCVSAGVVLFEPAEGEPEEVWERVLARYPSLAAQFEAARAEIGPRRIRRMQYRLKRAAGEGWAALPHAYAFFDPIFSTGIAWSLLGVERLARILEHRAEGRDRSGGPMAAEELERYRALLSLEADRVEALVYGAYRAMGDAELLFAFSQLYFAAVSFAEATQALDDAAARAAVWNGFLGVGDPVLDRVFESATRRLDAAPSADSAEAAGFRREFQSWVAAAIAPRNVAGLAEPAKNNLYPVDLEELVERAGLLGRSRSEMRALLPRLRAV